MESYRSHGINTRRIIFVIVCAFLLAAASLGNFILWILHLEMDTDAQYLVICAGIGVISVDEAPLAEMEAKGELVPIAQLIVQDFKGMRIQAVRAHVRVVILKVKNVEDRKSQVNH